MTTMNTVVAQVDGLKPNAYSDEDKYRWISRAETLIGQEVFGDGDTSRCLTAADADTPLRLRHPYDELYSLYVMAMIDFHNREYGSYNNTLLIFRERLEQLKARSIRVRKPGVPAQFRKVMG